MIFPSKKKTAFAIVAAVAATFILAAFHSTAEARPYKGKSVRHHSAAVHHVQSRTRHVHTRRAAQRTAYGQRGRYAQRATNGRRYVQRSARYRNAAPAAAQANFAQNASFGSGFGGGSGLVAQARRYLGTNPTGMSALWCARFMNMVLERSGRRGTGSNMASSFANYGRRVSGPQVGAIAVMSRGKRGGHVGVVSSIDASGNPIIISGNYGRRVAEAKISRSRVYAYVMP
jgi:uncharacterized protein (TIGR02594 family)